MAIRVALNLVFLVPGETGGMETYAREVIPRLAEIDGLELTCLINLESAAAGGGPWGEVCPAEVVPVRARNRIEWIRGEQWYVPRIASRIGAQIVHSLASTAPLHGPQVRVTTIHDLNYLLVPEAHFGLRAQGMKLLVPAAARRSQRIIVDAASTRDDICQRIGIARSKIDVVPLAAEVPLSAAATPEAELREWLQLGLREVALSPGAKRPHKNLAAVLKALALMPSGSRPLLVVPGYITPYEQELRELAAALGVSDDLRFVGYLSSEEMEGLYRLSSLVVVPSKYEGFGLPVLEAMVRGVPVVTSDRSSLPEVAGGAALLVSPDDPRAIADAIRQILDDPAVADRLRSAGLQRAADFSWEKTAELTAASYARALGSAA
jgi:glycosyltransferase involved in cell wall biosynthesis